MAATIRDIEARIKRLSDATGLILHVGTWAPGDGWTRYYIADEREQNPLGDRFYRKSELYEALGFAISAAYAGRRAEKAGT